MKNILLILLFSLLLFGCIDNSFLATGEVPNIHKGLSYEEIDLSHLLNIQNGDVFVNEKTANIELSPSLEGVGEISLNVKSNSNLKLNSIYNNETHNVIDLDTVIINSYFEKKPSKIITLGETPTIENNKVKQTITVENTENIAKDITMSLNFEIDTNEIEVAGSKIIITADKPVVFKTDNFDLDFKYDEYSGYSFVYLVNGEIHNFDWLDMKGVEHAVIITTDNEISSQIEIRSIIHLEPLETVIFDPSYSKKELTKVVGLTEFTGLSGIKDMKIADINGDGEKDYILMTEDNIYYIKNEGAFTASGNDISHHTTTKIKLPGMPSGLKFTGITVNDLDNDGKDDILVTIELLGAYLIMGDQMPSGEVMLDIYNPEYGYSFASPIGAYYFFENPYISNEEEIICFGVPTYPKDGLQYTHNVFCFKYPWGGPLIAGSTNAYSFMHSDIWYRTEYEGGSGCAGVPYIFKDQLYVGAPCANGVSKINSLTSNTYTYSSPTQIGPTNFGRQFTSSDNKLYVLADRRILQLTSEGSIDFVSLSDPINSIASDENYLYAGTEGAIYVINKDAEIVLELNDADLTGSITTGSLGAPTDDGFYAMEITEDDVCTDPPLGDWEIYDDTTICAGEWNRPVIEGETAYIKVMSDDITITCQDSTTLIGTNLDPSGGITGAGININSYDNVTLENCEFVNYGTGAAIQNGNNNKILRNIFRNSDTGIAIESGNGNMISLNTIHENQMGLIIGNSNSNMIANNNISLNSQGIILNSATDGNNNQFQNNEITQNDMGIFLMSCGAGLPNNFNSDMICDNGIDVQIGMDGSNCWDSSTNFDVECNTVDPALSDFCNIPCGGAVPTCGARILIANCADISNPAHCQNYYELDSGIAYECERTIAGMPGNWCRQGDPCTYDGCVDLNDPDTFAGRIEFNSDTNRFYILESITLCEDTYTIESNLYFYDNNIILDCNESEIINIGDDTVDGITINGYSDSIIKNCYISDFNSGITANTGLGGSLNNLQILNNTLDGNTNGINLWVTDNHLIENNTVFGSVYGMRLQNSGTGTGETSEVSNNEVYGNEIGMSLSNDGPAIINVHDNHIYDNVDTGYFLNYGGSGILLSTAKFNIYNNLIETNNIGISFEFQLVGNTNVYNNIIIENLNYGIGSSGIFLPIFSTQNIHDNDLCSNNGAYDIYFPIGLPGNINTINNSCEAGRKYISGTISDCDNSCFVFVPDCVNLNDPSTFNLDGDLIPNIGVDIGGDLFVNQDVTLCRDTYNIDRSIGLFINSSNIVLDCNGSTLNGTDATIGIYNDISFSGGTNVTVKNCIIQNFETVGIEFINGADEGKILNNTLIDNSGIGIEIADSQNCLVEDNILINNSGGIWLDTDIDGTQINNNYMCDNTDYDIVSAELTSAGIDNTCTLMPLWGVWNDTGATGCTNKCPSTSANVCAHVESLSTPLRHGSPFTYNSTSYVAIADCADAEWDGWAITDMAGAPVKKYVITANLSSARTCLDIGVNDIEIEGCGKTINSTTIRPPYEAIKIMNHNNILINNVTLLSRLFLTETNNNLIIKNSETQNFRIEDDSNILFNNSNIKLGDAESLIQDNSKVEFRNSIINPESTTRELTIRDNSQTTFNNTNIENTQIIYIPKNTILNVYVNNIDDEADIIESASITSSDDSYKVIFENVEQTGIRQIFESYLSRDSLDSDEEYNLQILNSKLYSLRLSNNTKTKIKYSYLGFEESDISYPSLEIKTSASNSKTIFDNSNISYFNTSTELPEDQFHIGGNLTILNDENCSIGGGSGKIFIRQYPVLINGTDSGKCLNITANSTNLDRSNFIDYEIIRTSSEDELINLICKYVNVGGTVENCNVKITTIDDSYCIDPTS